MLKRPLPPATASSQSPSPSTARLPVRTLGMGFERFASLHSLMLIVYHLSACQDLEPPREQTSAHAPEGLSRLVQLRRGRHTTKVAVDIPRPEIPD